MPLVDTTQDDQARTLTFVTELAAPPDRVWQLWADPRRLERWWGPPSWPATFTQLDLRVGGRASYHLTGPDDQQPASWWRVVTVDEPRLLEIDEGTAHPDGSPDESWPVTRIRVDLAEVDLAEVDLAGVDLAGVDQAVHDAGTRLTIVVRFGSPDDMRRLLDLGLRDGMSAAVGQLDEVLSAG